MEIIAAILIGEFEGVPLTVLPTVSKIPLENEGWLGVCGGWVDGCEAGLGGGRATIHGSRAKETTGFPRNSA